MSEDLIEQPTDDAAPAEDAGVEEQPEQPQAAELDADNLDATLEAHAIQIPDGDKLVPLSAVLNARGKLKEAKEAAAKVPGLEQRAQQLEQQLSQLQPAAEALRALQAAAQAQQHQPQQPQGPTPEQKAEAEAFARDFDLYKADGTPDVDRASRILDRQNRTVAATAQQIAQQYVAPLVNRTVSTDIAHNFERAKITEVNGIKPDPAILKSYFDRMATTADGIKSLTNPEAVAIITKHAIFDTWTATGGKGAAPVKPATPAAEIPAPIFSEKAGGQDSPQMSISGNERKLAREMYPTLTEAQAVSAYSKAAARMPWRNG